MTEIVEVKALRDGVSEGFELTAGAAQMSAKAGQDERFCLLVENGASAAVGVKVLPGDGIRAGAGELVAVVAAGKLGIIQLDSARFKQLSGENKGKFLVELMDETGKTAFASASSVKLAALYL